MDVARGGMLEPRTCMRPFLSLTLIVVDSGHCWNNDFASSLLCEPPYTNRTYGGVGGWRRWLRLLPDRACATARSEVLYSTWWRWGL